jgi:hypothetical protein
MAFISSCRQICMIINLSLRKKLRSIIQYLPTYHGPWTARSCFSHIYARGIQRCTCNVWPELEFVWSFWSSQLNDICWLEVAAAAAGWACDVLVWGGTKANGGLVPVNYCLELCRIHASYYVLTLCLAHPNQSITDMVISCCTCMHDWWLTVVAGMDMIIN